MKKEVIISIFVVLLVIVGNIVTQKYTDKCLAQISKQLNNMKEQISNEEEQQDNLKNKTKEIKQTWDDMQENLAFYIEHDELEKVEVQLALLEGEVNAKLYSDAVPEIEKCIFILEHIQDKTALNVKNIF